MAGPDSMQFRISKASDARWPPLILLHGSGGSEMDMLPLAASVAPGAAALSLRGAIPWEEGYAFFRRRPDRSLDEASLRDEAQALAGFLRQLPVSQGWTERPVLIGFSNGAIMAAALVLLFPELMRGAALLRPLSPFAPSAVPRLDGMPILVLDAARDERRQPQDGADQAALLSQAGAAVSHRSTASGHRLCEDDLEILRDWLARAFPADRRGPLSGV